MVELSKEIKALLTELGTRIDGLHYRFGSEVVEPLRIGKKGGNVEVDLGVHKVFIVGDRVYRVPNAILASRRDDHMRIREGLAIETFLDQASHLVPSGYCFAVDDNELDERTRNTEWEPPTSEIA